MEVEALRKELCTIENGSFADGQLCENSSTVIKTFRGLNLNAEERPMKRRRTAPEPEKDVNDSMYEQIVLALSGNSQETPVLSLSNIRNIIE